MNYTTFLIKRETETDSEESSPHPKTNLHLEWTKSPSRVIRFLFLQQRLKQLSSTNHLNFINLNLVKMSPIWKAMNMFVSSPHNENKQTDQTEKSE